MTAAEIPDGGAFTIPYSKIKNHEQINFLSIKIFDERHTTYLNIQTSVINVNYNINKYNMRHTQISIYNCNHTQLYLRATLRWFQYSKMTYTYLYICIFILGKIRKNVGEHFLNLMQRLRKNCLQN
jgi:hypothetical protein